MVNLVSKKPERRNTMFDLTGSTSATARTQRRYLRQHGRTGRFRAGLSHGGDHVDEDYWRISAPSGNVIAPSLVWYGERQLLFASNIANSYPVRPWHADRSAHQSPVGTSAQATSRRAVQRHGMAFGSVSLRTDHELNDDWKAHFGSLEPETYDASQVRVTAIDTNKGTLTRSMDGTHGAISTDRFTTASLEGKVKVLGMQHDLVFGVDDEYRKIYRADLIRQKSLSTFSYTNPVYGREVEGSTVSAADSAQTDELRSDSVFLQDSIHLNDQWILVAGGRFQEYDQYAGKGVPFKANTDSNGQKWVPRAVWCIALPTSCVSTAATPNIQTNSTIAPLSGSSTVLDGSIAPEEGSRGSWVRDWICRGHHRNIALFDIKNATCWWPIPKARRRFIARRAKCAPAV